MIYIFTGNNKYQIKEEIKKWKNHFITKFGDFNFIHIKNIEETDINTLSENLLAYSFMDGKKLVIIEDIEKIEKDKNKKEFIISNLEKIPKETIVLFSSYSIRKTSVLYKNILKYGEAKIFDVKNDFDLKNFINKKYNNQIENKAIDRIIAYKSNNLQKIISELDKLFITKDFIGENDIINFINPELEESIFVFVDKLLLKDISGILDDLEIILQNIDIYAFYNMLIGNLRNYVYIEFLKDIGCKKNEISEELSLGNKAFLINKPNKYNFEDLFNLYEKLINFDKNMKSGNFIGSKKQDLKFELEKIFISLSLSND